MLLTFTGAVLRSISLNSPLWCDEIVTVVQSVRIPTRLLLTTYFYDNQHTLYSLLAQGSVSIFGDAPWVVRLPAMICGTACIPALYLLGREFAGEFESLGAAGLLAVSYHHIWFSQNARGYTLLMLAAILATWLLIQGLRRPGFRPWFLYALTVATGMYTHLTMVFIPISHALICSLLWLLPQEEMKWLTGWKRPAAGLVLSAILTLVLYGPMASHVVNFFVNKPTGMKNVSTPRWALIEAWNVMQQGLGAVPIFTVLVLLTAVPVTICGLVSYLRQSRVAFALFVLPVIVTLAGALVLRGTLYPRFFFYLSGFGLLIAMRGISIIGQHLISLIGAKPAPQKAEYACSLLVSVVIICSAISLGSYYRSPKQDFEGAIAFVEEQSVVGEPVVTVGVSANFCIERYYGRPWHKLASASDLSKLLNKGRRVWVVYAFPRYLQSENAELALQIRQQVPVVREFPGTLSGGTVIVCRADPVGIGGSVP